MSQEVKLSQILVSEPNPRTRFAERELAQLKASIQHHGVLEPILLWS